MSTDLKQPSGLSALYYVTLHEVGHLLGIGSLWQYSVTVPPITSYLEDDNVTRNYYNGANALREYRNAFNDQTLVGIPIENNGGIGTANAHLEEGTEFGVTTNDRYINGKLYPGLDQELMTGWAEHFKFDMPLSRITIALLNDLGYSVNYANADVYNKPNTPWTKDITCTIIRNSNNNLITLNGNCFVDVNLLYLTDTTNNVIHGNLTYAGEDISHKIKNNITSNALLYTPALAEYDVSYSFAYLAYYYNTITNEFVYSNISNVTINIIEQQHPMTHDDVESLHLHLYINHSLSERLLNRALHVMLDAIPDGKCWEWAAAINVNNINEGGDPIFDIIHQRTNPQTNLFDVTWETKEIYIWIMRQLNYIAKHGITQFKNLYANLNLPPNLKGYWMLDPTSVKMNL